MPIAKSTKMASCVGALCLSIGVIAASGSAVAAVPKPAHSIPADGLSGKSSAIPSRSKSEPPGYTVVTNNFSVRNGSQSFGTADCPAGTVVWGGGAEIGTASLDANIGTSVPNGPGEWAVFVNNVSGADTDFNVYAICADQPPGYAIESSTEDNPAGRQTGASASCPKKAVVLGGGGVSSSPLPSVSLNSSWPTVVKHIGSWNVDMNNASSTDASVGAYVVCGKKPRSYKMVTGTATDNPSGAESNATATCTAGVPLGGGIRANSSAVSVNINSTFPLTPEWTSYENNGSGGDDTLTTYVLCAK